MFGTAGLPHILMRFFTVSDAKEARKSVFYATGFMGYFYILTFIIGFGAIMLVGANPAFKDAAGQLIGGNNMAAVHGGCGWRQPVPRVYLCGSLRHYHGGGGGPDPRRRVSGVARPVRQRLPQGRDRASGAEGLQDHRADPGVVAILLGILFENQNIAFMVGTAFSIAASCNFPIILLSMYWSKLTTRGAMVGGWLGLLTAVILMILGPTIWVQILGHEKALFPYEYPALFSIAIAFIGIWVFSATDNSPEGMREREQFRAQFIRSQTDRYRTRPCALIVLSLPGIVRGRDSPSVISKGDHPGGVGCPRGHRAPRPVIVSG